MSDKPLFQNTDEQEAAYAGDRPTDGGETGEGVILPGAAAAGPLTGGAIAGNMGTGQSGMTGVPAAGPEIAGAAHVPREDRDDDGVLEDPETQHR